METEVTNISKIKIPQCTMIKGIPLAFDESLSWLEQICAILSKLNETIEQVNKNTTWIDNYDDKFEEIEEQINTINLKLGNIQNDLNNKATKTELNNAISELNSSLRELIGSEYTVLKNYVDTEIERLQYEIDHIDIGNIMIYDPTTGLEENIQTVINNLYDSTRTNAISAGEFDALLLSATEYDSQEITAFNFDQNGKALLES